MNYRFFILLASLICGGIASAQAPSPEQQMRNITYIYPTSFGNAKFVKQSGELGDPAVRLELEGKPILLASTQRDGYGANQILMGFDLTNMRALDTVPKKEKKPGRPTTKRMIIAEGPDGNCYRKFILLDFTMEKPFVSKPFGENKEMKQCLTFENAKWGTKESRIKLENGGFLYKAGQEPVPLN